MATENITQGELAKRLNRTTKQLRNLGEKGLPRNDDGTYPWPEAQEWWVKFKQEEKERRSGSQGGVSELDKARAAKEWALAGQQQLKLDEMLGKLMDIDVAERELEACLVAVRSVLNNVPGKYAPRLLGCDSVGKAQLILQDIVDDALRALAEASTEIATTDGTDTPDGSRPVAA